jgi:formylglycine-generating enzyme required for sulfatase activity
VWCNALTEYYNAKNGSTLKCVYYTDPNYGTPLRSVNANTTLTHTTPGSQDYPYIYYSTEGNLDPANCTATGFRLSTAAEWENAARYIGDFDGDGSITNSALHECYPTTFISGADAINTAGTAGEDYDGNGELLIRTDLMNNSGATKNVASLKPNMLGIYDMNGNIYELQYEWVGSSPARMGGWYGGLITDTCTTLYSSSLADQAVDSIGFRVVRNAN